MMERVGCRKQWSVGNSGKDKGPTVHRKRMKVTFQG